MTHTKHRTKNRRAFKRFAGETHSSFRSYEAYQLGYEAAHDAKGFRVECRNPYPKGVRHNEWNRGRYTVRFPD